MSSDRTIYDEGAYMVKTKESSKPLSYMLDLGAHESCQVCGENPNVSNHADRVSLESDLFGINRKLSNDPKEKYQKSPKIANTLKYSPAFLCERNLKSDKFLTNDNVNNQYMENLKKLSPTQIEKFTQKDSQNKCNLVNYLNKNDKLPTQQ